MNSFMTTVQTNTIVQAVLFIVIGLVLLFVPGITLVTIVYLVGAVFALSGGLSLASYYKKGSPSYQMQGAMTTGIFFIVIALVMFIFPTAIAGVFSVLLGAVLILCGIVSLVRSIELKKMGGSVWTASTVISALVLVGGIVIIWNPFETTVVFVMVIGVLLLVNGIGELVIELSMRKRLEGK